MQTKHISLFPGHVRSPSVLHNEEITACREQSQLPQNILKASLKCPTTAIKTALPRYGLATARQLGALLGNVQRERKYIHVHVFSIS